LFVELVQSSAVPQAGWLADDEVLGFDVKGHRVGGVGLEFQRIDPCFRNRIHDLQRTLERAAVVPGQLRDDVWRLVWADLSPCDLHLSSFR
jgi:hypothetical protein